MLPVVLLADSELLFHTEAGQEQCWLRRTVGGALTEANGCGGRGASSTARRG